MTETPGEPISDGDAPTGDPDLAPGEQPDPATEPKVSPDQEGDQEGDQGSEQDTEDHLDADEGDPDLDSYPG